MVFVLRRVASAEASTNTRAHHPLNRSRDQIFLGSLGHASRNPPRTFLYADGVSDVGLDRHKQIGPNGAASFLRGRKRRARPRIPTENKEWERVSEPRGRVRGEEHSQVLRLSWG